MGTGDAGSSWSEWWGCSFRFCCCLIKLFFFFPFFTDFLARVPSTSGDKTASWLLRAATVPPPGRTFSRSLPFWGLFLLAEKGSTLFCPEPYPSPLCWHRGSSRRSQDDKAGVRSAPQEVVWGAQVGV